MVSFQMRPEGFTEGIRLISNTPKASRRESRAELTYTTKRRPRNKGLLNRFLNPLVFLR
jgi:hypothetical protein